MTDVERFFACLFKDAPNDARMTLWTLPGGRSEHLRVEPDRIARRAQELSLDHDVYFGVLPRKAGLPASRRGGKADLYSGNALWLDLDVGEEGHAAKDLPPDIGVACSLILAAGLPDPSCSVFSGYGLHLYWWLDHPMAPDEINVACKALQARVIEAGKARGWHIDQTGNADRVLRVPGTLNHKKAAL